MSTQTTFLLVEGPHDAEFIARLLKLKGFEQKKTLSAIPEQYRKLVPKDYPTKDENGNEAPLTEPHPVPRFYQSERGWVFILVGGGSKSAKTLAKALRVAGLNGFTPEAVGVVLDQDLEDTPVKARDLFITEFSKERDVPLNLDFKILPGTLAVMESTRVGLFILPDNQNTGALEDLLLECGEENYKELKRLALTFRDDALANGQLTADDLRSYGQPGGQKHTSKRKKAWVGAMGAILVPAAAIQNSIRDNRWLEGPALDLPRVKALQKFLDDLIA